MVLVVCVIGGDIISDMGQVGHCFRWTMTLQPFQFRPHQRGVVWVNANGAIHEINVISEINEGGRGVGVEDGEAGGGV